MLFSLKAELNIKSKDRKILFSQLKLNWRFDNPSSSGMLLALYRFFSSKVFLLCQSYQAASPYPTECPLLNTNIKNLSKQLSITLKATLNAMLGIPSIHGALLIFISLQTASNFYLETTCLTRIM